MQRGFTHVISRLSRFFSSLSRPSRSKNAHSWDCVFLRVRVVVVQGGGGNRLCERQARSHRLQPQQASAYTGCLLTTLLTSQHAHKPACSEVCS